MLNNGAVYEGIAELGYGELISESGVPIDSAVKVDVGLDIDECVSDRVVLGVIVPLSSSESDFEGFLESFMKSLNTCLVSTYSLFARM